MMKRRTARLLSGFGVLVLAIVLLAVFWNWDWFIPMADSRASAALGRKVTIRHLHVRLGRVTQVVVDDVQIDNPQGFPASAPPLARISHLKIRFSVVDYLFHHKTVVPLIDVNHPVINAIATPSGQNNYTLHFKSGSKSSSKNQPSSSPRIGDLTIEDGHVHAVLPKLKSNFTLLVATQKATGIVAQHGQPQQITVKAKGTYAGQPVTGTLIGGSLLTLRNKSQPYPVDLHLANGATKVSLIGTVQDPLAFKGANLALTLAGDNMADLYHLTAIPIPDTPKYRVTGQLGYGNHAFRFDNFHGVVGNSDLSGDIGEKVNVLTTGKSKPDVTMNLTSKRVDLVDLGGFIGTTPGGKHEAGATPAQRAKVARTEARSSNLLPNKPFNMPKLDKADIHLRYHADHIEGKSMPLDNLVVVMDIVNGAINLHPVSFGVGSGKIIGNISLTPEAQKQILAKANIDFDNVSVARLMAASHVFHGAGTVDGRATLDSTGNSIASWAANGDGGLTLTMQGGNLSALLVALSGLEFGNALISALGLPQKAQVLCFVGDFALNHGIISTRTLLLDTSTAVVRGGGTVDLKEQRINYFIRSKPKHFSIGSLPAPIDVTGSLKKPSIGPAKAPLAERGAAAAVLGVIALPLALLPTIQFGVKDPHQCHALLQEADAQVKSGKPGRPVPVKGHTPAAKPAAPMHVPAGHTTTRSLNERELQHAGGK